MNHTQINNIFIELRLQASYYLEEEKYILENPGSSIDDKLYHLGIIEGIALTLKLFDIDVEDVDNMTGLSIVELYSIDECKQDGYQIELVDASLSWVVNEYSSNQLSSHIDYNGKRAVAYDIDKNIFYSYYLD